MVSRTLFTYNLLKALALPGACRQQTLSGELLWDLWHATPDNPKSGMHSLRLVARAFCYVASIGSLSILLSQNSDHPYSEGDLQGVVQ